MSLKPDRKTANKTARINSDGRASRMTARPHTTSSARVSQDRNTAHIHKTARPHTDRTDKIATDQRHAWPRIKCERNFRNLYVNTVLATTTERCTVTVIKCIIRHFVVTMHADWYGMWSRGHAWRSSVAIYLCGLTYRITYRIRPPQGTGSASGVKQTWTVQ